MELFTAIDWGHVEEISSLLKKKVSFVKKDKNRFTPLLLAARRLGEVYTVVYNAKKKQYGEKLGEGEQMSALHFACCARDRNFVRRLLIRGADINERIPESCPLWPGYTPLQLCIELEFEDVARMLLSRGADLSILSPNGSTPIFMAVKKQLLELTRTMLCMYKSWSVNPIDKESGNSYLHFACNFDLVDVVEALLHYGADANLQNYNGSTPLHMARDVSVIKVMLRYGANLCMQDRRNYTPLHRAFGDDDMGALEAMFEGYHGQYRVNPVESMGLSHLHLASAYGFEAIVKDILDNCVVDINAFLNHDWTALHQAVLMRDDTAITQMLLDAGADVNAQGTRLNITPLHVAVRKDRPNQVALLLKWGADCNAISETQWPVLHEACQNLDVEIIKLLLEHGADPNAKGEVQQFTPLHAFAIGKGDSTYKDDRYGRIIRFLVEVGADLDACDLQGERPIDIASSKKDEGPLRALLFYCANIDEKRTDKLITIRIRNGYSIEALLEHLEVLRHANRRNLTSDDNVLLKRIIGSGLHSEKKVTSIRNECHKELEVLREMGLDICLTYSNIFKKNAIGVDRLWRRSEKLVELVESNELHRFPVYGDRLRLWYDDLQRVPSCLERALVVVKNHWNLDQDSIETIFRYFNSKELQAMAEAFEFIIMEPLIIGLASTSI